MRRDLPPPTTVPSNNVIDTADDMTNADTTNVIENVEGTTNTISTHNIVKGGTHSNKIVKK